MNPGCIPRQRSALPLTTKHLDPDLSLMPPPISLFFVTLFGFLVMYLAIFAPRGLRWVPGMRWLDGFGPRASRFTAALAGLAVAGIGLNRMGLIPESVFAIASFVWVILMIGVAGHDFGNAPGPSRPSPPPPEPVRKSRPPAPKDRRAAKRRARRRSG